MWECIIASLLGPAGLGCGHRLRPAELRMELQSEFLSPLPNGVCFCVCVCTGLNAQEDIKSLWHLFTQNKPLDCSIMSCGIMAFCTNASTDTSEHVPCSGRCCAGSIMTYSLQAGQLSNGTSCCVIWLP